MWRRPAVWQPLTLTLAQGERASHWQAWRLVLLALSCLIACPALPHAAERRPMPTIYPYLLDPAAYPDYTRRPVKVPTWATFDNQTQFITLRSFPQEGNRLVRVGEELDRYSQEWGLGRVIWPIIHQLQCENAKEMVQEVKRRGLYLFDFWGHVPGSGMEGFWSHIVPPPGMVEYMEQELGDHFLGIDNGEQDGRYVGGYAPQQCPSYQSRYEQYLNFQRHFERMGNDLGNHMSALTSLCFGHYWLKDGNHVLLGAETAQALPNSQVYYAFIRGAGKQYGVPWFGNASVWNRWSFKNYDGEGKSDGVPYGPDWGTSTNLLKRLMYTHIFYNSVAVGFESGWTQKGGGLSPIGRIQQAAARWVAEHGSPGVMHAPVALMLDHYAGWAMPRHLYTGRVFQVWGGMPYDEGDYLTDGVLSMLYPGYEDSGFYHDERGFLSPTPYGDIADCVLSDIPLWALRQYGLVIVAGRVTMTAEVRDTLRRFAQGGGWVVVTGGNADGLVPGLEVGQPVRMRAKTVVHWQDGTRQVEPHTFLISPLHLPRGASAMAVTGRHPLAATVPCGDGGFVVLASAFGVNAEPLVTGVKNEVDRPLARPYLLLEHVKRALGEMLKREALFRPAPGLGLITCRKGPGEYTLCIFNPGLQARPLGHLECQAGRLLSMREIPLDQSEKGQPGYWPTGMSKHDGGKSDRETIAGGDVRVFEVRVDEKQVRVLPRLKPPPRPHGRILAIRPAGTIQEAILARPTFFHHFDGVKVDWGYLHGRDAAQVARERGWLGRQQVRVVVDFSHGLNFYPDLTLLDTLDVRYQESTAAIDDVFAKMAALGSTDAVFTLHRIPENQCDGPRADARFLACVQDLCARAARRGITLYLQPHPEKWYGGRVEGIAEFITKVGAPNLRLAVNTGHGAMSDESPAEAREAGDKHPGMLGMVLYSAPARDGLGQTYDAHRPVWGSGLKTAPLAALDVPQVLDADYPDLDAEYRDGKTIWLKEYR